MAEQIHGGSEQVEAVDHRREAQECLALANRTDVPDVTPRNLLAEAQVHATLAVEKRLEELGGEVRREAEQQLETETHRLRVQLQDYRMRAVRAEQKLARAVLTEEDRERLQLIADQIDYAITRGQLPGDSFWRRDARYLDSLAKRGDNDDPEEATDGK